MDLNATQAAIRAGYSPKSANQNGPRMLVNAGISAEIARRQGEHVERSDLTASRVLEELRRVALSDVRTLFDENGELKPIYTQAAEQGATISGFEMVMKNATAGDGKIDRVLKVKLWDKVHALEMAMKHLALLQPDRSEVKPTQVSVEVKSIAVLLDGPQLESLRESLLARARTAAPDAPQSGAGRSRARLSKDA